MSRHIVEPPWNLPWIDSSLDGALNCARMDLLRVQYKDTEEQIDLWGLTCFPLMLPPSLPLPLLPCLMFSSFTASFVSLFSPLLLYLIFVLPFYLLPWILLSFPTFLHPLFPHFWSPPTSQLHPLLPYLFILLSYLLYLPIYYVFPSSYLFSFPTSSHPSLPSFSTSSSFPSIPPCSLPCPLISFPFPSFFPICFLTPSLVSLLPNLLLYPLQFVCAPAVLYVCVSCDWQLNWPC